MRRVGLILAAVVVAAGVARGAAGVARGAAAVRGGDVRGAVESAECRAWVDSVYASLSGRERVAQLFCPVVDPTRGETSRTLIRRYAGRERVGGLLLRGGTMGEYAEMVNLAQAEARVPVMMTLDGEWGPAMRVKEAPRFPYNMALGAIADSRLLEELGAEIARECREIGMSVDFAPVADVNLNLANPVIGRRSFGEDPERVAAAVVAVSRGMERGGVLTTAKHFPGHGDTSTDSHKTLPVVDHDGAFMRSNDLLPFRRYIDAGLSGVMVGHLSVPSLDPTMTPASLSRAITTGVLRDEMEFGGLVFTDALEMKGAVGGDANNCVSALKAGADVLLSSANPPADITAVEQAVKSGEISAAEVEAHCRRVLAYKWAAGLCARPAKVDVNGLKARLASDAALGLIERLTAASVTVTGNGDGVLPLKSGQSVALVNIGGAHSETGDVMARHGEVKVYAPGQQGVLTAAQLEDVKRHDVVVAAVYDDNAAAVTQLNALAGHCRPVAVMFMTPYKAMKFKKALAGARAVVMMYDNNAVARQVAGDALNAGTAVSGRLPVSMPGVAALGEGVTYPATRLSFATPHATVIPSWLTDSIDAVGRQAVRAGAFPGMQVMVVKDGRVVVDRCYGKVSKREGAAAVTPATLYDLASVSKALGTLPGVMLTRDRGLLDLERGIGEYIPRLAGTDKAGITPRMLLTHESGMPASLDMLDAMIDPGSYNGRLTRGKRVAPYTIKVGRRTWANANARLRRDITSATRREGMETETARDVWTGQATLDTIMERIYNVELKERRMRYSCLNFCLLMDIEQRLTGERHDELVYREIFGPLGATSLCYKPLERYEAARIAATEHDALLRRQTLQGYVHDELAAFSGGVQGNAGLFGSATDVAKVCMMYRGGGTYGGRRVLSDAVVREFTEGQSATSHRGLGFDRPNMDDPDRSAVPDVVPGEAYGHTGFTGTCFWVDPVNDLIYIFLSNRVNPTRDNGAWVRQKARSRMHELVYRSLGV